MCFYCVQTSPKALRLQCLNDFFVSFFFLQFLETEGKENYVPVGSLLLYPRRAILFGDKTTVKSLETLQIRL